MLYSRLLFAAAANTAYGTGIKPPRQQAQQICKLLQEVVQLLLLSLHRRQDGPATEDTSDGEQTGGDAAGPSAGMAASQPLQCQPLPLPWECCQDIIARAAYPVSIWL